MELHAVHVHANTVGRHKLSQLGLFVNIAMVLCEGEHPILSNNKLWINLFH